MRTIGATSRTRVERRRPPGNRQRAHKKGVEYERRVVLLADQGLQSAHQQQELLRSGLALLRGHTFGRLQHGLAGSPARIIAGEIRSVGGDRLHLVHDIERSADVHLHINQREWLQTGTESTRRSANAFGNRPDPPVRTREQRDNPIGLAKTLGPKYDGFITEYGHTGILSPTSHAPTIRHSTQVDSPMEDAMSQEPSTVRLDPTSARRVMITALAFWVGLQILVWVFDATGHFLFVLLLSWLLAIAMEPPVAALARRGWRRGLAAGVVLLCLVFLIAAFFSVFGGMFFSQLAAAVQALPGVVDSIVAWANDTFDANLDPQTITSELALTPEKVATIAGSVAGGVVGVVSSIVGFLFELLTILVFAFYLSAESPAVRRTLASWLRPNRQHVFITVWDIAVAKTGGFVVSRIVLAALSALAHILAFWAIGVPYWMPLGLFAGIVSQFIPTIGTYVGIVVPVAFAAPQQPLDALWIVLFATVYQQVENYVLGPRISKATMDLHPAITLAAVFVGAALFGPIGAIIGIPMAAAVIAVVDTYGHRYELVPELAEHITTDDVG